MKSLKDAAEQYDLPSEVVIRFISFKWIVPAESQDYFVLENQERLLLDDEDIARARLIYHLQQEFGVNDQAVPIILHLIDQLNRTQLEFKNREP
jgi:hypothetical protein